MAVEVVKDAHSALDKNFNYIKSTDFPIILNQILPALSEGNIIISKYKISDLHLHECIKEKVGTNTRQDIVIEKDVSELQYNVAKIVCGVLGCDEISIKDNFFKLGGNSLLVIDLVSNTRL